MPYRTPPAANNAEPPTRFSLRCWLGHHAWGPKEHVEFEQPTIGDGTPDGPGRLRIVVVAIKSGYFLYCQRCNKREFHRTANAEHVGTIAYYP